MSATDLIELEGIAAAVDTNVELELLSAHDLVNVYVDVGPNDVNAPKLVFRRARARESLVLAMYLHAMSLKTFALEREVKEKLLLLNPPEKLDEFTRHFTTWMGAFVKPEVLPNWTNATVDNCDEGLKGSQCDDRLLAIAKHNNWPLITNEGLRTDGTIDDGAGVRKKAIRAGVHACTPRQFWQGKFDEHDPNAPAIARFLAPLR